MLVWGPAGAPAAIPRSLLKVVQLDVVIVLGQRDDLAAALDGAFGKLLLLHAVCYRRRGIVMGPVVLNGLRMALIHGEWRLAFRVLCLQVLYITSVRPEVAYLKCGLFIALW